MCHLTSVGFDLIWQCVNAQVCSGSERMRGEKEKRKRERPAHKTAKSPRFLPPPLPWTPPSYTPNFHFIPKPLLQSSPVPIPLHTLSTYI